MYAVVKTGGKQYKVTQDQYLKVEKLEGDEGDTIELNQVLMIADGDNLKIGSPMLDGGKITATILSHGRHKKIEIMKFRRRKHHQKRTGHRQYYTEIKVTAING
ncbi:LSU ribosomal protein L21p [hydrothermal vent metagenome]|uniref:LSU ribosomal protein L21p n=1 Tax=hydrothermal vent metagenome TaxID=652676 RepID=A0A3B0YXC5_9ZZZZ